jgi:hypothetical protein
MGPWKVPPQSLATFGTWVQLVHPSSHQLMTIPLFSRKLF